MIAAWYDKQGPAAEVLQVGDLATPQPGVLGRHGPAGVNRIVEVAVSDNIDVDAAVVADNGVIAAYSSSDRPPRPTRAREPI
jgi:NADPH2:quinone reductase